MKITCMKKYHISQLLALWKHAGLLLENPKREIWEAEKMLSLNQSTCFVAVDNKKIIGSIFGIFNGRRAWIYHLAVHQKWQKLGIGKMLLLKAEKELKKLETTRINLWVELHNLKVTSFYEKYGFMAYDPGSILMKKDLIKL